eukprot:6212314-Pleurochrysis_carterae.AAC.2
MHARPCEQLARRGAPRAALRAERVAEVEEHEEEQHAVHRAEPRQTAAQEGETQHAPTERRCEAEAADDAHKPRVARRRREQDEHAADKRCRLEVAVRARVDTECEGENLHEDAHAHPRHAKDEQATAHDEVPTLRQALRFA